MKSGVLIKVLECMSRHCRNKTLSLTFYETRGAASGKRAITRKDFDNNLPDIYYIASVSTNNKTLTIMKREPGEDRTHDQIVSSIGNFNFDELADLQEKSYIVHRYNEISPFASNNHRVTDTGVYKHYEECLKFDGTLYVNLFKLMGETVSLVIESRNKIMLGHYIGGKIIIVDFTDWAVGMKIADFHSLGQYLPEYEVVDFVSYPNNLTIKNYIEKLQRASEKGGLQFLEN